MALTRLRIQVTALVATVVVLAAAASPAAAASTQVRVRVEGGSQTLVRATVTPFTGTIIGQRLTQPTALGGLIAGTRSANVPLGLQWFDCCGFYVNSVNGRAADATHYWAFKVNNTLAAQGAGTTPVTAGASYLFYFTRFDPVTFETQPTLGISENKSAVHSGSSLTVKVFSYNDAGVGTAHSGAQVYVGAKVVGQTNARGVLKTTLTTRGKFQVRATYPGAIRSGRLWVTVN